MSDSDPFVKFIERRERCRAYQVVSKRQTIADLPDLFGHNRWSVADTDDGGFEFMVFLPNNNQLRFRKRDFLVERLTSLEVVGPEEFIAKFEPEEQ